VVRRVVDTCLEETPSQGRQVSHSRLTVLTTGAIYRCAIVQVREVSLTSHVTQVSKQQVSDNETCCRCQTCPQPANNAWIFPDHTEWLDAVRCSDSYRKQRVWVRRLNHVMSRRDIDLSHSDTTPNSTNSHNDTVTHAAKILPNSDFMRLHIFELQVPTGYTDWCQCVTRIVTAT